MPTARGRRAVELRLESAGSAEFRRSPGLAGAPRASWGSCSPPPWGCLVLEPVKPAVQAGGPGTHGAGRGRHARTGTLDFLGRPPTQRHGRGAGVCGDTDLPPTCWP